MHPWDVAQYERFAAPRLRPALELLARVPLRSASTVVDLGCGTGAMFEALRARFPAARLIGVDSSPEMLARAVGADDLVVADAATWAPPPGTDLLYSNAALHWVDDHARLFPRLIDALAPGGVLAVQMPRNHDRPSHRLIADTVRSGPWRARLEPVLAPREWPVDDPTAYWDVLSGLVRTLDLWEVDYHLPLHGPDAVAEWTRGTALRPFLSALDEEEAAAFYEAYRARVGDAYPQRGDGTCVLAFRRLFFVATR